MCYKSNILRQFITVLSITILWDFENFIPSVTLSHPLEAFDTAEKTILYDITMFLDWFSKKTKTINQKYSNKTSEQNE